MLRLVFRLLICVLLAEPALAEPIPVAPKAGPDDYMGDNYPRPHVSFPGNVVSIPDLSFKVIPGYRPLTLDLYHPTDQGTSSSSGSYPIIVFVHGGGWGLGHSRNAGAILNFPDVLAQIASHGFIVASVNYRLSGEAPAPAAVQDIQSAIAWIRENGARYGGDARRIGIWGSSAGGQIAALVALDCPETSVRCLQAAVYWYGGFDLTTIAHLYANTSIKAYLACPGEECPSSALEAQSALAHVTSRSPPTLMVHGTKDSIVPIDQSIRFGEALKQVGVSERLVAIPDVDHSFVGNTQAETQRATDLAVSETVSFFERTLQMAQTK